LETDANLDELIINCRDLAALGYAPGNGGNASIRVKDGFWITAGGCALGKLNHNDFVLINEAGKKLAGNGLPSKEMQLHLGIYKKKPEVNVVFHFHPPNIIAACSLVKPGEDPLPAMTAAYVMQVGKVVLISFYIPGSEELAKAVESAAPDHDAVLMQNHGIISFGESIARVLQVIVNSEENARIYLLADRSGLAIPGNEIEKIKSAKGTGGTRQ
jgi:ribulose-5-phosphate 4-epimerase/fuculose-1-phosphate aldolase